MKNRVNSSSTYLERQPEWREKERNRGVKKQYAGRRGRKLLLNLNLISPFKPNQTRLMFVLLAAKQHHLSSLVHLDAHVGSPPPLPAHPPADGRPLLADPLSPLGVWQNEALRHPWTVLQCLPAGCHAPQHPAVSPSSVCSGLRLFTRRSILLMQHLHTSTKFCLFRRSPKLVPAYIVRNCIEFPSLVIQSYAAQCSAVFSIPVFRLVYCTFLCCQSCSKGISG